MFILKTIKLSNIFKEEKYTRRGRKYYRKRPVFSYVSFIVKAAAILWLCVCAVNYLKNDKASVDISEHFSAEKTAYTEEIKWDRLSEIKFEKKINKGEPLIIIFHTHAGEEYADTNEKGEKYTVVDAGSRLAEIFAEEYGITVVHDTAEYDAEGTEGSYEKSAEGVKKLPEKYPSAKVLIDLHRDMWGEGENAVKMWGKMYAPVMSVVGVCGINENGKKKDVGLENEFLEENLKFAYEFRKNCGEDICKKIYLKPYRYSTYLMPESLLLEVGNEKSTAEEVENSLKKAAKAIVKSAYIK